MIVRIALLLVSLPLLIHGADGLFHGLRSRTQAQVTCAGYHRARPSSAWVRPTECEIDYVRAGYRETRGRVTELFLPLRPLGSSPAQPSALVMSTRDPALLAIIERGLAGPAQKDQEAFLVMMLQIVKAMGVSTEIEGTTRSPLEMLRTRGALAAIKAPLERGFTVLDVGRRPRLLFPAIEAVVGATALLLFVLFPAIRRRSAERLGAAPVSPPVSAPVPVAPAGRQQDIRLRRLMLVNLPPNAPASALETAPPLGNQAAVRSALARVLPGIAFDADGIAQFNRPDYAIRLEIGRNPQVWTATLDVTGDAAAGALRRLITQTGWRVYAPLLGRFLTGEDLNG